MEQPMIHRDRSLLEQIMYMGLLRRAGEEVVEVNAEDYARVAVPCDQWRIRIVEGHMVLTNERTFCFARTESAWGAVQFVGFFSARQGGRRMYTMMLGSPGEIRAHSMILFGPGQIELALQDPL